VDVHAPRIRMLLELVANREVAELRGVAVPGDRMAPRPVPRRRSADIERHPNHVAGVETRAAHLRKFPTRPEITRAPFRIRLEAAGGEDDALCVHIDRLAGALDAHTFH